jgi:alpha-glucosidase (family GH31 glycosyl hydrolase)
MICPVLEEGMTTVSVYLPKEARWYRFPSGVEFEPIEDALILVDAPLDEVVLFVRGGVVFPTQTPGINTNVSSQNPFELVISIDANGWAEGRLYFDDGDSAGKPFDFRRITLL